MPPLNLIESAFTLSPSSPFTVGEGELELIKENEMDQLADRFSSIGIMQASCHMSCVGAGPSYFICC